MATIFRYTLRRFRGQILGWGLALSLLVLLIGARTLLRRPTLSYTSVARALGRRFWLKLFTAFVALAALPLLVLQGLVRSTVAARLADETRDQALERATMAK